MCRWEYAASCGGGAVTRGFSRYGNRYSQTTERHCGWLGLGPKSHCQLAPLVNHSNSKILLTGSAANQASPLLCLSWLFLPERKTFIIRPSIPFCLSLPECLHCSGIQTGARRCPSLRTLASAPLRVRDGGRQHLCSTSRFGEAEHDRSTFTFCRLGSPAGARAGLLDP